MKQRGMALLTVLLLLAVMVALAAVVNERWFFSFQYCLHLHQRLQGKWYAAGAESVAAGLLRLDALDDPRHTHLAQRWATRQQTLPLDDAQLSVTIADAQACFNLNSLGDERTRTVFTRMLVLREFDTHEAQAIAAAVTDWISPLPEGLPDGAKDNTYAAFTPPRLTAEQALWDVSELRQIRGIDASRYARLQPLVCALPAKGLAINLNTLTLAQWPLVAALAEDISEEDVRRWLALRPGDGWTTLEAAFSGLPQLAGQRHFLTLNSDYFTAHIVAWMADSAWYQTSLLARKSGAVSVIWRRQEADEK